MKTPISRALAAMIPVLSAALLLVQCAPGGGNPPRNTPVSAAPAAFPKQHWVQVSSRPPTFYPRGVAADSPTDCHSGEWVYTGDAQDTRYFIPVHDCGGIPRRTLVNEALAARSGRKQRQIAVEDLEFNATRVILSPVALVWGMCPL